MIHSDLWLLFVLFVNRQNKYPSYSIARQLIMWSLYFVFGNFKRKLNLFEIMIQIILMFKKPYLYIPTWYSSSHLDTFFAQSYTNNPLLYHPKWPSQGARLGRHRYTAAYERTVYSVSWRRGRIQGLKWDRIGHVEIRLWNECGIFTSKNWIDHNSCLLQRHPRCFTKRLAQYDQTLTGLPSWFKKPTLFITNLKVFYTPLTTASSMLYWNSGPLWSNPISGLAS